MWSFIQGSIVFAVVASNIKWHWTPSGYLASMLGGAAALLVTLIANDISELRARKKREGRTKPLL